ncbi:unnamed protein product, partial [Mesorhabditis belari]|uniref:Cyclin-like domain-containing protein n=1 Tax=Mesorhabditis belari TaxID=2138241 RepID=A0AAF3EGE3_9BILA
MVKKYKGTYHLLVAQNYLSSLKRTPRIVDEKEAFDEEDDVKKQSTSTEPLIDLENQVVKGKKRGQYVTSKRSIFARISRIVSADEMMQRDEEIEMRMREDEERPGSPASTKEGFTFLKRLKHTLVRAESCERMRHASGQFGNELRPFDFKDDEHEFNFSSLIGGFQRQRTQTMDGVEKSPRVQRRSSAIGSLLGVDSINHPSGVSRASSCEPEIAKIREICEMEADEHIEEIPYSAEIFEKFESGQQMHGGSAGYTSSFSHFRAQDEAKRELNERFRLQFPHIHLTFTKFKSIKRELVSLAFTCELDASTLATALVYFERIVFKGLISKFNRKLVAGACLIVAVKVTDVGRMKIRDVVGEVENRLRESRRELLSYELPICVSLDFDLLPSETFLRPHMDRITFRIV